MLPLQLSTPAAGPAVFSALLEEVLPILIRRIHFNCVYLRVHGAAAGFCRQQNLPHTVGNGDRHLVTVAVGGQVEIALVVSRSAAAQSSFSVTQVTCRNCRSNGWSMLSELTSHSAALHPPHRKIRVRRRYGHQHSAISLQGAAVVVSTFRLLSVPVRSQKRCMPPDWKVFATGCQ